MASKKTAADMPVRWMRKAALLSTGLLALWIGGMALALPQQTLQASLRGLSVWWEVLFPALFPFFVLSELLLGFGVVHLTGSLLDPLMRPLFRIPGVGGFVVAMGFASGYPVGARLTSRLMEQRLLSREEGERLVAMTTSSDPIFLIGAVCIGFFGRADVAPVMAAAHYGGAMLLGFALRRGGRQRREDDAETEAGAPESAMRSTGRQAAGSATGPGGRVRLRHAVAAMHRARLADGRPFGVMLQDALKSSLQLMIVVGGLVVFFSAALELLLHSGVLSSLRFGFGRLLGAAGLVPGLSEAVVQGAFEVTLGARAAAEAARSAPLVDQVAAAAFVLSWAGLSVHAQVAGLMSRTRWRYLPFLRARLLHAVIAAALVYLLWPLLGPPV